MYIIKSSSSKYFNNRMWREIINQFSSKIESETGIKTYGICPWGFEIFRNKVFLQKNIRRYFCYFGILNPVDDNELFQISNFVADNFLSFISERQPELSDDIVCLLSQERVRLLKDKTYQCKTNDKLLSVFVYKTEDILNDYCNYIICSLDALNSRKGEARDYKTSILFRWRLFQLYLILEELFSDYCRSLDNIEKRMKKSIINFTNNLIQPFFTRN